MRSAIARVRGITSTHTFIDEWNEPSCLYCVSMHQMALPERQRTPTFYHCAMHATNMIIKAVRASCLATPSAQFALLCKVVTSLRRINGLYHRQAGQPSHLANYDVLLLLLLLLRRDATTAAVVCRVASV